MQKKCIVCVLIPWGILLSLQVNSNDPEKRCRIIHNNDGSNALGNYWFHKRPLTMHDVNAYVDMGSHSQVTTYMMYTGSDFFYYRSKHGRILDDDLDEKLNCGNDTTSNCHITYPEFWYAHPEFWTNDDTPGLNGSRALYFVHPEVRAHKLAIIREQLEKYDWKRAPRYTGLSDLT